MTKVLEKFVSDFKSVYTFTEVKVPKEFTGSLITKVSLSPTKVFELMEVIFDHYDDPHGDITFIDNKTNWERYIVGKHGTYRVYEYRGSTSIGSNGSTFLIQPSEEYRNEAWELKKALEESWPKYEVDKAEHLKEELADRPMANFTRAFLSTKILLERATKAGSLLELLVMNAALLDGTLRLGIILAIQLRERNDNVNQDLIFQGGKKHISEREIYRMAKDEGILTEDDFTEINALYDFRNMAIHRFFISGIEYNEINPVLKRYEAILDQIRAPIHAMEERQVKEGIGMTKKEHLELDDETIKQIYREQYLKIDSKKPVAVVPIRKFLFDKDG